MKLEDYGFKIYRGSICEGCDFIGDFLGHKIYQCNDYFNAIAGHKDFLIYHPGAQGISYLLSDLLIIYNLTNVQGRKLEME